MLNMDKEELKKLGLTNGEAKAYLSLLFLGSSTVGPISKKSVISYSKIYEVLDRLIEKGLVSFIIKEGTKYFQAASPEKLVEFLDKKEKEIAERKKSLKKILPELEKLHELNTGQEAEVFLGQKGLMSAYNRLMKNTTKKDEALFFNLYKEEDAEQVNLFYNSISDISKSPNNRGIVPRELKNSWFIKKSKFLNIKFVDFPVPGNIDIIKDKVMIITWNPAPTAILIHSKAIAENFRDYFNSVWEIAKNS
jgi:HTH-type transcriptional regulator, sugar sensing transcriptional regulator